MMERHCSSLLAFVCQLALSLSLSLSLSLLLADSHSLHVNIIANYINIYNLPSSLIYNIYLYTYIYQIPFNSNIIFCQPVMGRGKKVWKIIISNLFLLGGPFLTSTLNDIKVSFIPLDIFEVIIFDRGWAGVPTIKTFYIDYFSLELLRWGWGRHCQQSEK